MEPNTKKPAVVEPDFEGEAMKIPATMKIETEKKMPNNTLVNAPILLLLFAILVSLLGGIYFWYTMLMEEVEKPVVTRPTDAMNQEPESPTAKARTAATDVVSTSDDLDAIRADIESTSFTDLDDSFNTVENELNSALDGR